MASMRDIKRRRGSIQSTQQITKAMKLVSTVKLQRARSEAERSKSYFGCMYATVGEMLGRLKNTDHPYLRGGSNGKKAVIVLTGNRGLAGGYNSNIVKLVSRSGLASKEDMLIYGVGSKGRDALAKEGYKVVLEADGLMEAPTYQGANALGRRLLEDFAKGEFGEIYLAFTAFKNTVSHVPTLMKLLPVEEVAGNQEQTAPQALMNFEPVEEEALGMIIPKYISSLIYGALKEAVASENGARMQAMDSATNNAAEMIEDLTLKYNRARQSSITQELTEIIAGAEAIS